MSHKPDITGSQQHRLDELVSEYVGRLERGEPIDHEQLLAEHPEIAEPLRQALERHRESAALSPGQGVVVGTLTAVSAGDDSPTLGYHGPDKAGSVEEPAAADDTGRVLRYFGDYELIAEIARGGMGVVYKARQVKLNRLVAVKTILSGQLATPDDVRRFHVEAEAAANLDHPGIVPVYEVGEQEGCHFFSMGYVEGQSLAARLTAGPLPPLEAAAIVRDVALAVEYAHQQGVIHRDLKPQNILLDRQARPRVTDFGLAKRVTKDSGLTGAGEVLGTPSYMPPEQAAGRADRIGPAADVYSLGGVLYAALTGRPPFQAATPVETVMQVLHREPAAPRQLNAAVPRDLETIALKCLEKEAQRRYASAQELADELARYLRGEPIHARPISRPLRAWRWCRRHPQLAGLWAVSVLLMSFILVAAGLRLADIPVARARAQGRHEEAILGNLYAAQGAASTVLLRLRQLAGAVEKVSQSGRLRAIAESGDRTGLVEFLEQTRLAYADPQQALARPEDQSPFESWFVVDPRGTGLARSPAAEAFADVDFSWRDYFARSHRGRRHAGTASAHISRVYRSRADRLYKFAISVPVWSGDQDDARLLGVLVASVTTGSSLGLPRLQDQRHKAVLIGRRDLGRPEGELVPSGSDYVVLVHPAYGHGDEAAEIHQPQLQLLERGHRADELRMPDADQAPATIDDYSDPLAGRDRAYAGRWLAGLAPVGQTGFVVVVQQRYDEALDHDQSLGRDLALWGSATLILIIGLAAVALNFGLKRRALRGGRPGESC